MITAKVIQDSCYKGIRITTFELEYPRFIHSEFMTHRMFSRNSASSRAIPVSKVLNLIKASPAMPIHWGKNEQGMQASTELEGNDLIAAHNVWSRAAQRAVYYAEELNGLKAHKQIVNRITEPFQHIKTVVTATEWDNWYELRNHKDAQPEIQELARQMALAHNNSDPMGVQPGEWHVPYVTRERVQGKMLYATNDVLLTPQDAKIVSASCCAQVSYRNTDDTVEKAKLMYDRLIGMRPKHSSPFEHQATPIKQQLFFERQWDDGVTHCDNIGQLWSGNFRGWIQHRQLL